MSKILKCKCQHQDQDQMYGPGNRVHNETKEPGEYRCTVCLAVNKEGNKR
jgi:hypothetical protein